MADTPVWPPLTRLPLIVATILLLVGGMWLLNRAAAQTRDTTRKHQLDDLEHGLYFARDTLGTYPPYDAPTWCGELNAPSSEGVRAQVEAALRAQNAKYANPAKPFPADDFFYWKRSPAIFELYAHLEAAPTGDRSTMLCPGARAQLYDYGLVSVQREL